MAAVFVGSFVNLTFDGDFGPWQSGLFGFYDADLSIIPMHQHAFFVNDTIGLKSLNDSNN